MKRARVHSNQIFVPESVVVYNLKDVYPIMFWNNVIELQLSELT